MTWKIQATTGEFAGQSITIDQDMLVGRHQDANIVLQSAEISRRHAAFLLKEQQLFLQDLNSSNGTFVNGERITVETALKQGDVLAFASLQFALALEPAEQQPASVPELNAVVQPSEAVATSATLEATQAQAAAVQAAQSAASTDDQAKPAAAQMNEQGMPSVAERAQDVEVSTEGMPKRVDIPKPAPIPEGVDVHAKPEPTPVAIPEPVSDVKKAEEDKKNTSVGLMTIIALVILAILAWLFLK